MEKLNIITTTSDPNEIEDLDLIVTNTFETEDFDATEEFLAKCTSIHACQVCDEVFRRKKDLMLHMNESYDCRTKKIFRCVECQQMFPTVGEFQLHLVSHFQDEQSSNKNDGETSDIVCELCGKDFTDAVERKKHLESHFEKNGSILCPTCGKCLCSKEMYMRHSLVHSYQSGKMQKMKKQKQFPCKICNKGFSTASTLRDHLYLHTGEKTFECSCCKKVFATKSSLRCHLKLQFKPYTAVNIKLEDEIDKKVMEKDCSVKKEKNQDINIESTFKSKDEINNQVKIERANIS
ncbi:gastrula zinc finger protein XlCGF28.1-like [Diorhabda sublineata]|uniref:gastrula zinc finger protein XlCGF28.1-like n=1 Tax=Diorhabda sublineata TaxID=1163346 RepID=UPI0024E05B44|nr:gastrula zinc finger protein XlCGF28.1-like [Diorhabda sublineata]